MTVSEYRLKLFLSNDTDVGLGNLRKIHIFGALAIVRQHAIRRNFKLWAPSVEMLQDIVQKMTGRIDTLSR